MYVHQPTRKRLTVDARTGMPRNMFYRTEAPAPYPNKDNRLAEPRATRSGRARAATRDDQPVRRMATHLGARGQGPAGPG